jgi:D-arabinose 1-dehydrogenase-like Zn-dependent alcohol dehydrogenase
LETKLPPGSKIGVIGIGGLGSLAVQLSKALGYQVVAIDNRPEGRELAVEFPLKADFVVDNTKDDAEAKIKEWAGDGGLPGIVVCVDRVPVIKWGLELLRPNGIYVPLGLPSPDMLEFNSFTLIFKSLTIKGSLVATQKNAQEMLNTVATHGVKNHLTVVSFEEGVNLPTMYWDDHLKGRLVLKY